MLFVFIAQVVHLSLLAIVAREKFNINLFFINTRGTFGKYAFFPIGVVWLISLYFYYKNKIISRRNSLKTNTVCSLFQLLLLSILVIVIPLYIAIKLSGGEIWR